jgi:hypothetical protein
MKTFAEVRQDPHRPSAMDPSEYVYVGCADDYGDDSYMEIRHDVLARFDVKTGSSDQQSAHNVPWYDATQDGRPNYRCHHCGKHGSNIRYFVFFLHKPSKVVITVGQICAKKLNLGSKDELDLQKRANAFRRLHERGEWVRNHPAEHDFLKNYDAQRQDGGKYNEFFESLWEGIQKYGSLTDKQLNALSHQIERWNSLSDKAKASYYAQRAWNQDTPAMTHKQRAFIEKLMETREMTDEARQKAHEIVPTLNKKTASNWISKLLSLPER